MSSLAAGLLAILPGKVPSETQPLHAAACYVRRLCVAMRPGSAGQQHLELSGGEGSTEGDALPSVSWVTSSRHSMKPDH